MLIQFCIIYTIKVFWAKVKKIKNMLEYILLSVSVGFFVFLLQKTDFVYEYSIVLLTALGSQKILDRLNITGYEKSRNYETFIMYLASLYGIEKNLKGFALRLISCFVCFSTFLNSVIFLFINPLWIFCGSFISIVIFYVSFKIQKQIYS